MSRSTRSSLRAAPWLVLGLVFLLSGAGNDDAALQSTGFALLGMALAMRWRRPCRIAGQ